MTTSLSKTDADAAEGGPRPKWGWLALLLAVAAVPQAALALWAGMPAAVAAALALAGVGCLIACGLVALQIARQMRTAIAAQEESARSLRDLEARTRSILDTAGDGIITYDEGGRIRGFNKAAAEIFGYEPREILGTKVWDLVSGQTSDGMRLDTGEATILDRGSTVLGRRRDDRRIPLEPAISKVRTAQGILYTLVVRDLSEQKKAEAELHRARADLAQRVQERTTELQQLNTRLETKNEKLERANEALATQVRERQRAEEGLRRSEARYQALVQVAPDAILIYCGDQVVFANPAAVRLFGASAEELRGLTLSELVQPDSLQAVRELLRQALESRRRHAPVDLRMQAHSGGLLEVEATAAAFKEGEETAIQLVLRDVVERKHAEAVQREAERRQRALARQLLEAQEAERRHLARELHDEIGQVLTAIKITLQAAKRVADPATNNLLDDTIELADKTLAQVRNLSVDLRPAALDTLGLVPSLRGLLDRQAERSHLAMHLEAELPATRLPPDLETACYRVVQEAVTNVLRHANAREVWVRVHVRGNELVLSVRDDGIGFDVARASSQGIAGTSMGLLGLHERAQLVGGNLEILSSPGRGTDLRVRMPLPDAEREGTEVNSHGADSRTAG